MYIIGAGPGDPELITVKGARLIRECPVILYTGSLVPKTLFDNVPETTTILDSAGMNLEEIIEVITDARDKNQDVARVHTGDSSIYGSTGEQMRVLDKLGIEYEIVPGVSSFLAASAAIKKELTLPELSQTVIVSRVEGRTTMPEKEQLADLAKHESTLVLFLSITLLNKIEEELIPVRGADCPVAVIHKASMPEQKIITGTLGDIREKVKAAKIASQSIIIIGEVLTSTDFADSRLYSAEFFHRFRKKTS